MSEPETPAGADAALPVKVEVHPNDVRKLRFSDARINEALDRQLAGVPADAKVAIVATAFKEPGGDLRTKLALYVSRPIGDRGVLSFGGFLEGDAKRPLQKVGAELRFVN